MVGDMIYLMFCRRCMYRARHDADLTPNDGCGMCSGTGYITATMSQVSRHKAGFKVEWP